MRKYITKIAAVTGVILMAGCGSATGSKPVETATPVVEQTPTQTPTEQEQTPMVMIEGKLYYDTGKESTLIGRCGVMDGKITSSVDPSNIPTEDNQSNFGNGYGFQYGIEENTIEVCKDDKWEVFEYRGDQDTEK